MKEDEPRRGRALWTIGALMVAAMLLDAGRAVAEPYMAIREGRRCSTCHVNMSGPGKRTELAITHLQEITHYKDLFPELANATDNFNGQITRFFSIGSDLRVTDTVVLQDAPDANGDVKHAFGRSRVEENIFELRRGLGYAEVDLIPDYLLLYGDFQVTSGGSFVDREAFGLVKGLLPWKGYFKAGRFMPEYGLRTENDDLFARDNDQNKIFVRGRTGTDFTDYQEGVEFGFEPGPFHFSTSVTNGSSGTDTVRVTADVYTVLRDLPVVNNLLVGGSMLRNAPNGSERIAFGFFAGSNLGPLEYQGEVDFIDDHTDATTGMNAQPAKTVGRFVTYGELNYLAFGWVNCKAFGEYSDHDGDPATMGDDAQNRFGIGVEPFIGRYLQPRLFFSVANGVHSRPEDNQDRVVMEFHFFF